MTKNRTFCLFIISSSSPQLSTSRHGRQPIFLDVPMVCITDEETASAAEVLVGCLKDQRRCYAIGERTYGKGLAQGLYKLPDGR